MSKHIEQRTEVTDISSYRAREIVKLYLNTSFMKKKKKDIA